MIELLQEYWRPFLYSDGQHITGLAMTMWLLTAALVIGFLVSIPLSIAWMRFRTLARWMCCAPTGPAPGRPRRLRESPPSP